MKTHIVDFVEQGRLYICLDVVVGTGEISSDAQFLIECGYIPHGSAFVVSVDSEIHYVQPFVKKGLMSFSSDSLKAILKGQEVLIDHIKSLFNKKDQE